MPLTGAIPEGRSFFCPHCGALYSVTYSRLPDSNDLGGRRPNLGCPHFRAVCANYPPELPQVSPLFRDECSFLFVPTR
jgi:hypothetical protein